MNMAIVINLIKRIHKKLINESLNQPKNMFMSKKYKSL